MPGMDRRCFTLTELLIVIAIIAMLAGLLLPALERSQREAREASCYSNLRQFGAAAEQYRGESESQFPLWLSQLNALGYIEGSKGLYICPLDESRGIEGGRPDWITQNSQYAETNDLDPMDTFFTTADQSQLPGNLNEYRTSFGVFGVRPTEFERGFDIEKCSYLYEFTHEYVSWGTNHTTKEGPYGLPYKSTWADAKNYEIRNAKIDGKGIGPLVPVVRCFHHIPAQSDGSLHDPYKAKYNSATKETTTISSGDNNVRAENRNVINLRYSFAVNKSWPESWWK